MHRTTRVLSAVGALAVAAALVVAVPAPAFAYSVESWPVGESPIGVTLSSDSSTLFVAERGDGVTTPALAALDAQTGALLWRLPLAGEPTAVIASPIDDHHVFVASYNAGAVWEVDTLTSPGTVTQTITGGGGPVALAVSPTGDRLFVGTLTNPQWQVDLSSYVRTDFTALAGVRGVAVSFNDGFLNATVPSLDLVQRFDISGPVPVSVTTIGVGDEPWGIANDPTRLAGYVSNSAAPNSLSAITPAGVEATVATGDGVRGVAVYPDASRIYVAGLNSGLNVITRSSFTNDAITVGGATEGVAVAPDGNRVYLSSAADDSVKVFTRPTVASPGDQRVDEGSPVTFAPAIAYSPDGYLWQRSDDGGAGWTDIPGATTASYSFSPTLADSGAQFRLVLTSRIFPDTVSVAGTLAVDEVLAPSGAEGVVPMMGGALVLLLAGGALLVFARRRLV